MELTPYQNVQTALNNPAARQATTLDASLTRVSAASQSQHLEMELVTAEGDRVTLSLESQSRSLAVQYTGMHAEPNQVSFSQGEISASEQEQSMTMTLEGDLNEQEKKDLGKVLKTLKKMMADFVNDRLKPMMAKANQLGKLDTVAGLDVEMDYSRQVMTAEQTRIDTTYNQQGALEQPGAQARRPAERPPRPEDNWRALHQEAQALTDAMAEQMKQAHQFIEKMQDRIRDMFNDFHDRVAAWNPAEPAGPELIGTMHADLMAKAPADNPLSQESEE